MAVFVLDKRKQPLMPCSEKRARKLLQAGRAPRFLNRTKPVGWLAPSLQHRVDTTRAWVDRSQRLTPIVAIAQELVRFYMQQMENPEIFGVEYQQGTLVGYETRAPTVVRGTCHCR